MWYSSPPLNSKQRGLIILIIIVLARLMEVLSQPPQVLLIVMTLLATVPTQGVQLAPPLIKYALLAVQAVGRQSRSELLMDQYMPTQFQQQGKS